MLLHRPLIKLVNHINYVLNGECLTFCLGILIILVILDILDSMQDQKEKQQYLFQEVIEKNYDPEQFQEYLTSAKEGGDDLNNWSIDQLKEVVTKFQKKFDKDSSQQQKSNVNEEESVSVDRRSIIDEYIEEEQMDRMTNKSKKGQKMEESEVDVNSETYKREIECLKIDFSSIFAAKNISVSVVRFEKKEGGLFEQSYVSYFINTPILGKTVQRRYSDFQWLRDILQYMYPGMPIPPIAKKGQFRRYDDKHLKKRMMILEMFLSKLLQIPEFKASPVIENFLKLDDKVAFEKFKAANAKGKKMIPFKSVKNIKGTIDCGFDPKMNGFLQRSQRLLNQTQPQIKLLYKQFKSAATSLESCGQTMKGIAEKCQALNEVQRSFRKSNEIPYCANNFFTLLSETTTRLAHQIINQARIFRTEMYSILKYESLYMLNVLDSYQALAGVQQKYLESKTALAKKKLKLYEEGNVEKWQAERKFDKNSKADCLKAMLPQETRKLNKIADVYGLYNQAMHDQIYRHFTTKNIQLANRFLNSCKSQTRLCSQLMMIWVDAQTNIMGINENKNIIKY